MYKCDSSKYNKEKYHGSGNNEDKKLKKNKGKGKGTYS